MKENTKESCVSCDSPKGVKCDCFETEIIQDSFCWINDSQVECEKCLEKFTPVLGFQPLEQHFEMHMRSQK